ncbi:MAG: biopolymer transporter ExbD [Rhizobiales bacterium]|nr:biopolymer transporter ExbD [Hyphomicrobiales bacterium]
MIKLATSKTSGKVLVGLTSLVDVVFILLIFFMLASSFNDWRGIQMSLPSTSGESADFPNPILLSLDADNRISFEDQELNFADLALRLGAAIEADPDRRIIIRVAADVPLQDSVNLLDLIDRVGGRDALLIENRDGGVGN